MTTWEFKERKNFFKESTEQMANKSNEYILKTESIRQLHQKNFHSTVRQRRSEICVNYDEVEGL